MKDLDDNWLWIVGWLVSGLVMVTLITAIRDYNIEELKAGYRSKSEVTYGPEK